MTREEAAKTIESAKHFAYDAIYEEAFDMSIKALEQEPTTKNDLGVDCIKKSDAIDIIQDMHGLARVDVISDAVNRIIAMPSVTPQEQQTFKWCTDCKEYDQEKHCCHRWSKVIRNTVEEMKQEQEPIIDKIRAEILKEHENAYAREDDDTAYGLSMALDILDKYKAETEDV